MSKASKPQSRKPRQLGWHKVLRGFSSRRLVSSIPVALRRIVQAQVLLSNRSFERMRIESWKWCRVTHRSVLAGRSKPRRPFLSFRRLLRCWFRERRREINLSLRRRGLGGRSVFVEWFMLLEQLTGCSLILSPRFRASRLAASRLCAMLDSSSFCILSSSPLSCVKEGIVFGS